MQNVRVALTVMVAVGLGSMLCGVVSAEEDVAPKKPHPRAAARAGAWGGAEMEDLAKLSPAERAQRRLKQIWWNRPAVLKLVALGDAQRQKMDEAYVAGMAAAGTSGASAGKKNEALATALAKGEWVGARTLRAEASEADAKLRLQELETVIAVIELLTDEQRTKLGAERPFIMRGAWARTMPAAPMMRRVRQTGPQKAAP